MKRFAIPLGGLLCLGLWACVQQVPAPPPPPPPGPPLAVTSVSCADGSDLLSHVQYVQLLARANTELTYTPDNMPIDPAIQRDLAAAFTANPAFSKNELCPSATGLDGIFINRVGCINPSNSGDYDPSNCSGMADTDIAANSWGLRTPSNRKYVSISLGLWRCQSGRGYCAPSFTQLHQRLVNAVLVKTAGMQVNINSPTFQIPAGGGPDTPGLGVLTALAHERGHIYWWEQFVQTPGDTPSQTTLMSEARLFCGGRIYPGGRWRGMPVDLPNMRYVEFAQLNPNSSIAVANLRALLRSGDPTDATVAAGVVDAIYVGGRYPSLLAAYSPDEDFVEAFQWSVLRKAGLSELVVHGHPVLQRGHAGTGAEPKLQCFDALSN